VGINKSLRFVGRHQTDFTFRSPSASSGAERRIDFFA